MPLNNPLFVRHFFSVPLNPLPSNPAIRLGIRAHDIGRYSADVLACKVSELGLDCVQLALGKAITGFDPQTRSITPALAGEIGSAFAARNVGIEVLGCYINPIHPDPVARAAAYGFFKAHLRHARSFGCGMVALESGSLNADYSAHPDNGSEQAFLNLSAGLRELVAEAEYCGVVVGIEAVTSHVLSTPERMRRLLDEIPSAHLQVVFDPVNLLSPSNHFSQSDIIGQALDLFGGRIGVIHAKDFRIEGERMVTCPAGTGMLDYGPLIAWAARQKPGIAVLLEETPPEHVASCVSYLRDPECMPIS